MIWLLWYYFKTFGVMNSLILFPRTKSGKLIIGVIILAGHFLNTRKRILIGWILILKLILLAILGHDLLLTKPRLLIKLIHIVSGINPLIFRIVYIRQITQRRKSFNIIIRRLYLLINVNLIVILLMDLFWVGWGQLLEWLCRTFLF